LFLSMKRKISGEEVSEVLKGLEGNILIVEGRKDERALRSLLPGHTRLEPRGNAIILKINSRPLLEVAQDAGSLMQKHKNREVIIMTDFDRAGRKLAAKIRPFLQVMKIHANSRVRRDVMNLGISHIEEMASIPGMPGACAEGGMSRKPSVSGIAKSRGDDYGEIGANFYEIRGKGLHKGKRDNREARRDRGHIRAD
jgi:5S rRNA maturation endonuclease (ribonuclease M5)